mmetsp:Transcript_105492/g.235537  ORF Transcript_105492/g.235537 Transcript_105492/m.235537 type:complete len:227 (+) Transcript_105492:3-683(+)
MAPAQRPCDSGPGCRTQRPRPRRTGLGLRPLRQKRPPSSSVRRWPKARPRRSAPGPTPRGRPGRWRSGRSRRLQHRAEPQPDASRPARLSAASCSSSARSWQRRSRGPRLASLIWRRSRRSRSGPCRRPRPSTVSACVPARSGLWTSRCNSQVSAGRQRPRQGALPRASLTSKPSWRAGRRQQRRPLPRLEGRVASSYRLPKPRIGSSHCSWRKSRGLWRRRRAML